jgi:leader peptidase (prepilin peptidase)/N-methyltransferase
MIIDILVLIFGLNFGSFLNVLIYRLPLENSFFTPVRSSCATCNYQLKWWQNIPVLSYILLKARCYSCKNKISIVYPIVEIITSVVTFILIKKFGFSFNTYLLIGIFYTLIVLSFIDFKYKAVPDYLLLIVLILVLFLQDIFYIYMLIFAGAFILLDFVLTFYIQNIKAKITKNKDLLEQTALGEGDIPIVAVIGGILGLDLALLAIFLSAIFAILPSIYNILKKDDIETPFIPFLVLGLFVSLIFGSEILSIISNIL